MRTISNVAASGSGNSASSLSTYASRAGASGNALMPELEGEPDLLVVKHVHSAFHGDPDLNEWLRTRDVDAVPSVASPPTSAARPPRAWHATSATASASSSTPQARSPRTTPRGDTLTPGETARAVAASLHGEFAEVVDTHEALDEAS